jgi:MOSC domain-containing protein YiiM
MVRILQSNVLSIFICEDKGQSMVAVRSAAVIKNKGILGDRYESGSGSFSKKEPGKRHITFIASEAIKTANEEFKTNFVAEDTRRNIVTEGIDLNSLVDKTFTVGGVLCKGMELCNPCKRPSMLCGKDGFKEAFEGRGGLRAQVLSFGTISTGDSFFL